MPKTPADAFLEAAHLTLADAAELAAVAARHRRAAGWTQNTKGLWSDGGVALMRLPVALDLYLGEFHARARSRSRSTTVRRGPERLLKNAGPLTLVRTMLATEAACPRCGAPPSERCRRQNPQAQAHAERERAAARERRRVAGEAGG